MPAWGTVTISPACRLILFLVSPVSISSLRLMVMMLVSGGGSAGAGGFADAAVVPEAEDADGASFGAPEVCEVRTGSEEECGVSLGIVASAGTVAAGCC